MLHCIHVPQYRPGTPQELSIQTVLSLWWSGNIPKFEIEESYELPLPHVRRLPCTGLCPCRNSVGGCAINQAILQVDGGVCPQYGLHLWFQSWMKNVMLSNADLLWDDSKNVWWKTLRLLLVWGNRWRRSSLLQDMGLLGWRWCSQSQRTFLQHNSAMIWWAQQFNSQGTQRWYLAAIAPWCRTSCTGQLSRPLKQQRPTWRPGPVMCMDKLDVCNWFWLVLIDAKWCQWDLTLDKNQPCLVKLRGLRSRRSWVQSSRRQRIKPLWRSPCSQPKLTEFCKHQRILSDFRRFSAESLWEEGH